ncbi:MAG: histidine phosphatase family protein [Candidatus Vogelbacteria bacterium]|nr:histidine phosphatase family protein [Candidatus Vogelbacteria bacterium]
MKKLIVVRHGEDRSDKEGEKLTLDGEADIVRLANLLRELVGGKSLEVFSSPAPRAVQSAEIIAFTLGVDGAVIQTSLADIDNDSGDDEVAALAEFIDGSHRSDVVIVVTHYTIPERLIAHWVKMKLDQKIFGPGRANKGQANILDCETGQVTWHIPK